MATSNASSDQMYFRLCSDHISLEAIPRRRIRVNLTKMKSEHLPNYELLMWTPHFVVLRNQIGQEITLREDGRMIVRRAETEDVARKLANDIMNMVVKEYTA